MIQLILGGARGGWALVDDIDEWVVQFRWSLDGRGYVQRKNGKAPTTLHREVMGFPAGLVDHVNRDRTDNRRANLRVVTPLANAQNIPARGGTSKWRGVYRHSCGRWAATGKDNGRSVHLGLFVHEEEAADAARNWRLRHMPGAVD